MNKEKLQAFSARITQASKSELVVIQYEIILESIEIARQAYEEDDLERFSKNLKKAQKFVTELMTTLDYQYSISYDLLSLYLYANRTILVALVKKAIDDLVGVEIAIKKLKEGFEEISKDDKTGPVMQNTQQLYAGLTYGRENLNESYMDLDNNRGYKA